MVAGRRAAVCNDAFDSVVYSLNAVAGSVSLAGAALPTEALINSASVMR
ncbi:MAG: hypothetical protein ACR5LF_02835 [Symbiopectobacterium sp.]